MTLEKILREIPEWQQEKARELASKILETELPDYLAKRAFEMANKEASCEGLKEFYDTLAVAYLVLHHEIKEKRP